jgi:Tol biopolymer transport system component/DNA-binding winged helix-turn-helix (wHTH) protein
MVDFSSSSGETMPLSSQTPHVLRFGVFEVDLREGELRKSGLRIKLQDQPFQVLVMLLERPGKMVTREELQRKLWPADTFVDFDHSLNSAVKKLREALGDQPENPRFVETLHRRGYRFIAPVERQLNASGVHTGPQREAQAGNIGPGAGEAAARSVVPRWVTIAGVAGALLTAGSVVAWWVSPLPAPRVLNYTQITKDGEDKANVLTIGSIPPPIVTDGSRLYFTETQRGGSNAIGQVSVTGGETAIIPTSFPNAGVIGISPSGSDLLVYTWSANEVRVPLWVVPVLGGSPRRVGDVTQDATWSPDGQIVYSRDHDLYVAQSDGTAARKLVSAAGLPVWPRWSPDGKVLRFTEHDPKKDSSSLWEVSADGTQLRPLLPDWSNHAAECCGNWTPDGRYFVFQSTRNGRADLWAIGRKQNSSRNANREPVQLTAGPMSLSLPLPSKDGKKLFALGTKLRGELVRYDSKSSQFVPYMDGISAIGVASSRDGDWVAYVTYPEGNLWRSKEDGSQRLQLTFPPLEVIAPRLSPEGKRIVFMGRKPGQGWRLYLVAFEGGSSPQELTPGDEGQAAPDWSPDGNSVVFGGFPEEISGDASATSIHLLDLKTHQTSMLLGSEGLYCPRWSPDGRYISATSADGRKLMLFGVANRKWTEPENLPEGCPAWSHDGKYLYFQSFDVKEPAFFRMRISDRKRERLTGINLRRVQADWFWWNGLAPDDSPLVLRDESSEEIYALDWLLP